MKGVYQGEDRLDKGYKSKKLQNLLLGYKTTSLCIGLLCHIVQICSEKFDSLNVVLLV